MWRAFSVHAYFYTRSRLPAGRVTMEYDKILALVKEGTLGNKHLTLEQNERLFKSQWQHAFGAYGSQMLEWVVSTAHYTETLASLGANASLSDFSIFWLRLYGLFNEVREDFARKLKTFEEMFAGKPVPRQLLDDIEILKAPLAALDKALALFSEDDLLYLKYRRDTEAHVWQDAYRLSVKGKKLRETLRVFGRDWPVDELNARIQQVLLKHKAQVSEASIAVDFARRLAPVMPEVVAEVAQFCTHRS
jgi:hypothetical protein